MLICTKRETNIADKEKVLKNPSWHEADQLAIYTLQPREFTWATEKIVAGWRT